MFAGFIQRFLQKPKEKKYKDDMEKFAEARREREKGQSKKSKTFEKFVNKAEVKRTIKTWMKKWKYKKRGVMALLYILWLNGDNDSKIIKTAKDILSKLKGEDIFAKFLNVLKLAPEEKMD